MNGSGGWRSWIPALGAGVVAAVLYGATLMVDVSGCSSEYCADVGEFQQLAGGDAGIFVGIVKG